MSVSEGRWSGCTSNSPSRRLTSRGADRVDRQTSRWFDELS